MPADSLYSRFKAIDGRLGLHQIAASVGQLSFMEQHSQALLDTLNVTLEITYARAPVGRQAKGQTYELQRKEGPVPLVRERLLEQLIWKGWNFQAFSLHEKPFFGDVCRFIRTFQMPLRGTMKDSSYGDKIDLVGVTPDNLPVVIELKAENATDTPLELLVEGLKYACAVRKAWNESVLRAEWADAMKKDGLLQKPAQILLKVPVILLAPSIFWQRKIGTSVKRSEGMVFENAWPIFHKLVHQCERHGFPIHFVQFEIEHTGENGSTVSDFAAVRLPGTK